jgi:hypothetical protein
MAGIHGKDIAFFQRQEYITAIDSIKEVRHNPRLGLPLPQQTVEFIIPKSPIDFIDFKHSDLYCKVCVVKKDRSNFVIARREETKRNARTGEEEKVPVDDFTSEETEFAIPINLLLHTMWKSCDVVVQHNTVSTCGNFYPYKAFMDTIIEMSEDEKNLLYTEGYVHDDGNVYNYHPFGGVRGERFSAINTGQRTRYEWSRDGAVLEMKGPLRTDIWTQEHLILNNVDITVKLEPSSEAFRLCYHPSSMKCELEFLELQLILRRVRLNNKVLDGINAGLKKMPAQYPHRKTDFRVYQIPKGSFSRDLDDIWQNQVPSKVIAAFVDAESFNGVPHKNPLCFEHCDITSIGLFKDYEPATHQPFEMNFKQGIFIEPLLTLWRITCKGKVCKNIGVSKENFKNGYTFFCFNVDPSVPYDMSFWGPIKKGNMKMSIKFGESGTTKPMNLLLYAIFPGTVQLDSTRTVVRDSPSGTS